MQVTISLIITLLVFICFVTEIIPIPVTAVLGAILMGICGVAPLESVFTGFANDTVILIIGVSVLGNAVFEVGLAKKIGDLLIKSVAKNEKLFLVTLIVFSAVVSMFISNIAAVAMFIPITASVAAASNGKISKRNTMMYIGIASGVGGICTLIGSPPQMLANGLMKQAGYGGFSFFEFAYVGLPLLLLLIVYAVTVGNKIMGKGIAPENCEAVSSENKADIPKYKQIIVSLVFFGCITGFCVQIWTTGTVAMFGALIIIITKCLPLKTAFAKMDWTTAFTIAGVLGFADGLVKSGTSAKIAEVFIKVLGQNSPETVYIIAFVFMIMILTNIISNVACTVLFVPIAISIAASLNMDVKMFVMAVVFGASLSWATPIGAPPMTMTMGAGGYRFMDYVKVGGLYTVLASAVCCIIITIM